MEENETVTNCNGLKIDYERSESVTNCNQLKLIKKEQNRINGDRLSPVEFGFAKRNEFSNRDDLSRFETSCCRWKRLLQGDEHFIVIVADWGLLVRKMCEKVRLFIKKTVFL